MKKIIGLIIILFGGISIGCGIFFQVSNKEIFSPKKKSDDEQVLVRAETKNRATVCKADMAMEEGFIQLNDYTKISFSYPTCVRELKKSYKRKNLTSEENDIKLDINYTSENPKSYLNTQRTFLISLKESNYYADFDFTDVIEVKLNDKQSFYYFDVTYNVVGYGNAKVAHDDWYVAYPFKNSESGEERTLTFAFSSQEKIIDAKTITNMVNTIKIEENAADYTHSKEEGNYLVGSILQNKYKDYDHGYKINYKYSKELPEQPSIDTDYNKVTFYLEELNKSKYVTLSVDNDYRTPKENAESYQKVITDATNTNRKNIKVTPVKYKKINDRNVYYFIGSYDNYHSETKKYISTSYVSYCYVELDTNDYVLVYLANINIPITESDINEYANFTVEEY